MIRYAAFALCLLAGCAAAGAQSLYTPPDGDFSVAFPSAPNVSSQPPHRSHDVGHRRYVVQEPTWAMVVAIDDYPDGELPQLADGGVYDRILRNRAEDEKAQLVSTRPARLSGRPCLEGTLVDSNGTVEEVRVLLIGDRMYQLTYAHPDGADPAGADDAFFGSFRITARSGSAAAP